MRFRALRPAAPVFAMTLLIAAMFGPPHIKVEQVTDAKHAPTPGAVLLVVGDHHQDSNRPAVTGRAEGVRDGRRMSKPITLTATSTKGRFGVTRQWNAGSPWLLVFTVAQDDHGDFGAAESVVKVDAAGKVVAIEYPKQRNARGDQYGRRATPAEIDAALTTLAASR